MQQLNGRREGKQHEYFHLLKDVLGSPDIFTKISSFLSFSDIETVFESAMFKEVASYELKFQQKVISDWRELATNGDSVYRRERDMRVEYSGIIPNGDEDFRENFITTDVETDSLIRVGGIRHFPHLSHFHVTRRVNSKESQNDENHETKVGTEVVSQTSPFPEDLLRQEILIVLVLNGFDFTFSSYRIYLPNLTAISIMDNALIQSIPHSFSGCLQLQTVRFKNCPRFDGFPTSVLKCMNNGRMLTVRQELFDEKIKVFEFDLVYTENYVMPDNPGLQIYDHVEYYGTEEVNEPLKDVFNSIYLSGCILTMQDVRKTCFKNGFKNLQHLFLLRRFHTVEE